jgi:hypothetical protein
MRGVDVRRRRLLQYQFQGLFRAGERFFKSVSSISARVSPCLQMTHFMVASGENQIL